jgi:hypothetical protein
MKTVYLTSNCKKELQKDIDKMKKSQPTIKVGIITKKGEWFSVLIENVKE